MIRIYAIAMIFSSKLIVLFLCIISSQAESTFWSKTLLDDVIFGTTSFISPSQLRCSFSASLDSSVASYTYNKQDKMCYVYSFIPTTNDGLTTYSGARTYNKIGESPQVAWSISAITTTTGVTSSTVATTNTPTITHSPATISVLTTTDNPTTTSTPTTTDSPTITSAPTTTDSPTTTSAPTTADSPTITIAPTTTDSPTTTSTPTTQSVINRQALCATFSSAGYVWDLTTTGCYKPYTEFYDLKTASNGNQTCIGDGGYLFRMTTLDKKQWLTNNLGLGLVWLGGQRIGGQFYWDSGETINAAFWDPLADLLDLNMGCVVYTQALLVPDYLSSRICSFIYNYVCEIPV